MISFAVVRRLVAESELENSCLIILKEHLKAGHEVEELIIGNLSAGEATDIYAIRNNLAEAAGVKLIGIEEAVAALRTFPREKKILLCHFGDDVKAYTVLVTADDSAVFGCISVPRKRVWREWKDADSKPF
jgi:hypothetical protein